MIAVTVFGLIILGIGALLFFLFYQNWNHGQYFRKRNVPYIGAGYCRFFRFLMGQIPISETEELMYKDAIKTKSPIVGFSDSFSVPSYFATDLKLIRNIYVKDFDHFVDRRNISGLTGNGKNNFLHKMIVSMTAEEWKEMRSKLSPTFTTGKLRRMFTIFNSSSHRMCQYINTILGPSGKEFDVCEAYSKYAMDVIASCAFGVDSKSFECAPGTKSEFEKMGHKLQFNAKFFMRFIFVLLAPNLARRLGIQVVKAEPQLYFRNVIMKVLEHRRKTGARQDDFLQLMMDAQEGLLKNEENSKETMEVMTGTDGGDSKPLISEEVHSLVFDDDTIVANSVLFFIAGYDTLQSLLIYATYQLAVDQDIQEKLLKEVSTALESHDGTLDYDAVSQMNYLDLFVQETLRYFPPASRTERLCTKDYKVPGTDIVIEKGKIVVMPVFGVHRDPNVFENPHRFDPERFLPESKTMRDPYSFAPFGHGPRNCIGMRFALIETKVMIANLVHKFKLGPSNNTDIPPKFGNSQSLKPKNGMKLKVQPRLKEFHL